MSTQIVRGFRSKKSVPVSRFEHMTFLSSPTVYLSTKSTGAVVNLLSHPQELPGSNPAPLTRERKDVKSKKTGSNQSNQFFSKWPNSETNLKFLTQGSGFAALNFVALHLLTEIPAETFLRNSDRFRIPDPTSDPIRCDPLLRSRDVIWNLAVHWKSEKDLFEKISTSVLFFNILQETGYFEKIESE